MVASWKEYGDWMRKSRSQSQNKVVGVANRFERDRKQGGVRGKVGTSFQEDLLVRTFDD